MVRAVQTDVMTRLAGLALLPVVEIPDAALAGPLAEALLAGGLPCAEITFRTPAAAAAIEVIASRYPEVLIGAGTVLSTDQVDLALASGAEFLVSPGCNPQVVRYALAKGAAMLPGACTPTEIEVAGSLGIDVIKFFPAGPAGGPAYLKALTAPYRSVRFVPTGGIDAGNLADYLAIPQVIAVGGSWMVPPALLGAGEFGLIADAVRAAVAAARDCRRR
jgi:2-dehydro-3-deoxyphosphogluconate aldolase / (4S)-4-hydroxy-2-oxoglutarate aldolase